MKNNSLYESGETVYVLINEDIVSAKFLHLNSQRNTVTVTSSNGIPVNIETRFQNVFQTFKNARAIKLGVGVEYNYYLAQSMYPRCGVATDMYIEYRNSESKIEQIVSVLVDEKWIIDANCLLLVDERQELQKVIKKTDNYLHTLNFWKKGNECFLFDEFYCKKTKRLFQFINN